MNSLLRAPYFLLAIILLTCSPSSNYLDKKSNDNSPSDEVAFEETTVVPEYELFVQPEVDILFVVDNSGSMYSHQRNLALNIGSFVDELVNYPFLDFHIGVISSDESDNGRLLGSPAFVTKLTPNYQNVLKNNLVLGTDGDGYRERFFETTIAALTDPNASGVNFGFMRENAILATVFITDTDDQSIFYSNPQDFYDEIIDIKRGRLSKYASYGVIIPSSVTGCARDEIAPTMIENFFKLSSGSFFSLCDPNFGQLLAEFGKDLVEKSAAFVPLSQQPKVETIQVSYGGIRIPNDAEKGWAYEPNRVGLIFGASIDIDPMDIKPNAKLKITFEPMAQ